MNFDLTKEQKMIRDEVRKFARKEIAPRAEEFERTSMILPTGHRLVWAPARRHNLVLAMADGREPRSGFSLMNISSAQWGNQTEKLSFWATHLPTVSHLPPGDPAAVLDVEHDAIRWYPTDVAEYAQVGHYYFLNGQFGEAAKHYSDAINKLPEPEESRSVVDHAPPGPSRLDDGSPGGELYRGGTYRPGARWTRRER